MRNQIKELWLDLWQRIRAQGDSIKTYNNLVSRYTEPHHAYHTLEHIEHCLVELEQVRFLINDCNAVELAIWYHDVIYDIRAKNNEEKSAEFAIKVIKKIHLSDVFGKKVAELILATKHIEIPEDYDAKLITDIDLSSLGSNWQKFEKNSRNIRREYEWVPEDEFLIKRSTILKSFIQRPSIYSTQFFRNKYEAQARRNIARSLA